MKSRFLIWLAGIFLMSSFLPGLGEQFNKLPALLNHYRHHLAYHGDISFVDFIDLHYGSDSKHKQEENHSDLPLFQLSAQTSVAVADEFFPRSPASPEAVFLLSVSGHEIQYTFKHLGSIFQPPRA